MKTDCAASTSWRAGDLGLRQRSGDLRARGGPEGQRATRRATEWVTLFVWPLGGCAFDSAGGLHVSRTFGAAAERGGAGGVVFPRASPVPAALAHTWATLVPVGPSSPFRRLAVAPAHMRLHLAASFGHTSLPHPQAAGPKFPIPPSSGLLFFSAPASTDVNNRTDAHPSLLPRRVAPSSDHSPDGSWAGSFLPPRS